MTDLLTAEDVLSQVRQACEKSLQAALYGRIRAEYTATGYMPLAAIIMLNLEQVPMWRRKANV